MVDCVCCQFPVKLHSCAALSLHDDRCPRMLTPTDPDVCLGMVRKKPLGPPDIQSVEDLLRQVQPQQVREGCLVWLLCCLMQQQAVLCVIVW